MLAVLLFLGAVPTTSPHDPFGSWLLAALSLWIVTCPTWILRPVRYQLKRTIVRGTMAFAVVGSAVLVGLTMMNKSGARHFASMGSLEEHLQGH
jgi:hypothetical protein